MNIIRLSFYKITITLVLIILSYFSTKFEKTIFVDDVWLHLLWNRKYISKISRCRYMLRFSFFLNVNLTFVVFNFSVIVLNYKMLFARNILCNVPTALRTLNSSQISFKNQLFKNMRKGYVIPCMQKYQNIRYMSDNIDNKDLQKVYYGILTPQIRAVKVLQ